MIAPLKFWIVLVLVLGIVTSSPIASKIDAKLQCAVCQFLQTNNGNMPKCSDKCEVLSDCEIVEILQTQTKRASSLNSTHFSNIAPKLEVHSTQCLANREIQIFNSDVSSNTCTLCFLVYDSLKYVNYNVLDNPELGEIKQIILEACGFINKDLCQALFEVDTLGAIIQAFKDSLGGFYDLIAVQGLGCPAYNELFAKC